MSFRVNFFFTSSLTYECKGLKFYCILLYQKGAKSISTLFTTISISGTSLNKFRKKKIIKVRSGEQVRQSQKNDFYANLHCPTAASSCLESDTSTGRIKFVTFRKTRLPNSARLPPIYKSDAYLLFVTLCIIKPI